MARFSDAPGVIAAKATLDFWHAQYLAALAFNGGARETLDLPELAGYGPFTIAAGYDALIAYRQAAYAYAQAVIAWKQQNSDKRVRVVGDSAPNQVQYPDVGNR